jgi:glycine hydroxymethyltransferase
MREPEMRQIAAWMGDILAEPDDTGLQARVRAAVAELGAQFPAPADQM